MEIIWLQTDEEKNKTKGFWNERELLLIKVKDLEWNKWNSQLSVFKVVSWSWKKYIPNVCIGLQVEEPLVAPINGNESPVYGIVYLPDM